MLNPEFQEKRNGDLAVLFFKESCPYCRDFKPTWNRVAKGLNKRWFRDSVVLDDETGELAPAPDVRKVDVAKFSNIQKSIGFPTVPCVALYKTGKPVIFLTTQDRSLPNILKLTENYYKRNQLPPKGEYLQGNTYGQWPPSDESQESPLRKIEEVTLPKIEEKRTLPRPAPAASAMPSPRRPNRRERSPEPATHDRESAKTLEPALGTTEDAMVDALFAKLLAKLVKNKTKL